MLRTGKQVWEATAKREAIGIRMEELDFHTQRYSVLITQCAVLTGFAFESMVHLKIPEELDWRLSAWFYGSLSLTVICSVYVVVCASCLIVFAQQLAILGEDGDNVEKAVMHMRKRRFLLFFTGFASLVTVVSAGTSLAWIKMGPIAAPVTAAFGVFALVTLYSVVDIFCAIGHRPLITGSTRLFTSTGYFDLATLHPTVGTPDVLAGAKHHEYV